MAALKRTKRVDYKDLNKLSSADLLPSFKTKRRYRPGSKIYEVERLISKRKSATKEDEYLVKWLEWPLWTCSWEPSIHLNEELIRGFSNPPNINPNRLQQASSIFIEAVIGILRSKAVKAIHSAEIRVDHDIIRYIFRGKGKLSRDMKSMLFEKNDFDRFCLPTYWHYYLNQLGQGVAVKFPIKLRTVLGMSKKHFILSNGELKQAPTSPIEKVILVVNRRACDRHNI